MEATTKLYSTIHTWTVHVAEEQAVFLPTSLFPLPLNSCEPQPEEPKDRLHTDSRFFGLAAFSQHDGWPCSTHRHSLRDVCTGFEWVDTTACSRARFASSRLAPPRGLDPLWMRSSVSISALKSNPPRKGDGPIEMLPPAPRSLDRENE